MSARKKTPVQDGKFESLLFKNALDLLVVLDFEGNVLGVSPSVTGLLGWKSEDFVDQDARDFIHPDDRDVVVERAGAILEGQAAHDFQCRFRHREGEWVTLHWSVSVDPETGTVHGIGREVASEDVWIGSDAVLRSIFRQLPDGVFVIDPEGRVVRSNAAARAMFGLAARSHVDLWSLLDRPEFESEGGSAPVQEVTGTRTDGTTFPVLISVAGWPEEPELSIVVARDLTRRRREEERRAAELRMRESAELKLNTARELHDGVLQTLSAIGIRLSMVRRLMPNDPQAAANTLQSLADVVQAEQRELRLYVNELKLEAPIWADREMGLEQRLNEMLDRISSIWGVECTAQVEGDGAALEAATQRQILRVIQEALVNAATHGGARKMSVRLSIEGGAIHIVLGDDGHGFPFKGDFPYETLIQERLGPVSLKQRVQQCGGRISILSTDRGSTVSVELPTTFPGDEL